MSISGFTSASEHEANELDAPDYVLHHFLLDKFKHDRSLYFHQIGLPRPHTSADRRGMILPAHARINFNTLFNTFFERHWQDFTSVEEVRCRLCTSGEIQISLMRLSENGGVACLQSTRAVGDNQITDFAVALSSPSKLQLGRLYIEVVSGLEGASLHEASWRTTKLPQRDVRLALIMCTFNKPKAVVKNILELVCDGPDEIEAIIVVDQGSNKVREVLPDSLTPKNLVIIEQSNYGGAGGFTSGMLEAMDHTSASHLLLMDDDVDLDVRTLDRLVSLLGFSQDVEVVGGEMFDLYKPTYMHAHAETIDYTRMQHVTLSPTGLDWASQSARSALLSPRHGTYNGWWLCCYPRSIIETYGLPLPFFIRGDDVEYGTRLTSEKIPLRNLPGLMIWHEPFYAKLTAWMMYYESRNLLIIANLRRGDPSFQSYFTYFKKFWIYISSYNYDHAFALCLALEDYLKGPAFVFSDPRDRHAQIISDLRTFAPDVQRVTGYLPIQEQPQPVFRHSTPKLLVVLLSVVWNLQRAPRAGDLDAAPRCLELKHFSWFFCHGQRAIAVHNPHTEQVLRFNADRTMARHLTRRMLGLLWRWRLVAAAMTLSYRDAAPSCSERPFWDAYFSAGERRLWRFNAGVAPGTNQAKKQREV